MTTSQGWGVDQGAATFLERHTGVVAGAEAGAGVGAEAAGLACTQEVEVGMGTAEEDPQDHHPPLRLDHSQGPPCPVRRKVRKGGWGL